MSRESNKAALLKRLKKKVTPPETIQDPLHAAIGLQNAARDFYRSGNYEEAISLYTQALNGLPSYETQISYPILHMRGLCYHELKNYRLAIQDLKAAFIKAPNKTDAYDTALGMIRSQIDLLEKEPTHPDVENLFQEIIESSTRLLKDPTLPKEKMHNIRLKACISYINNNPEHTKYDKLILEDTSYFITKFDRKENITPDERKQLFDCLTLRGTVYLRAQNFQEALKNYNHNDENLRSNAEWEFMTRAYVGAKNNDKALECAAKITPKEPGSSIIANINTLLFLIAKSTAEFEKGIYTEAAETLQKITSYTPDDAYTYMCLAYCYQELHNSDKNNELDYSDKIENSINKALLIDPEIYKLFFTDANEAISSTYKETAYHTSEIEKDAATTVEDKPDTKAFNKSPQHKKEKQTIRFVSKPDLSTQNITPPNQVIKWKLPSDGKPIPDMNGKNKGFGKAWSDWLPETATLYTYFDKKSDSIVQLRASKKTDHGLYKQLKGIITDGHIVGPTAESGIKPLSGPMKGKFEAKIISERAKNTRIYGEEVSSLDGRHKLILFRECRAAMHR